MVETFPVGRRLAFDPAKGRLWVVCRRCERWNLSPLEERWEAIEDCDRLFRDTRLRISTDNIGMAKLREGLELIRIGEPLRPEFAAWRYGDQFGRRRRRAILIGTAGGVVAGAALIGTAAVGGSFGFIYGWHGIYQAIDDSRVVARVRNDRGQMSKVQKKHLNRSRIVLASDGDWRLHLKHAGGELDLEGEDAIQMTGRVMAGLNRAGGPKKAVRSAVDRIEAAGGPSRYFVEASRESERLRREKAGNNPRKLKKTTAGSLKVLPVEARLALEMATQEEAERYALEEDLAILEAAWREAEEVAAISDNMFLPEGTEEFLNRHRGDRQG